MLIRCGYDIRFEAATPVPMLALLSIHPSRNQDLRTPHRIAVSPDVPIYDFVDGFGNVCTRMTVPEGGLDLACDFVIEDSGAPDLLATDGVLTDGSSGSLVQQAQSAGARTLMMTGNPDRC